MNLTAKLFDSGPFVRQGDRRRGAAAPVVITGNISTTQAIAYAAVAVPVIERDGRLVAADPQGNPATVDDVAKWYKVLADDSFGFRLEAPAPWWKGVKGVFFALLYEIDLGDRTFSRLLALLRDGPIEFSALKMILDSIQVLEVESSPRWPERVANEMRAAVEAFLSRRAADLEQGLVTLDGGAQPGALRTFTESADAAPAEDEPAADEIAFAVASCQYPAGMLDEKPAHASYERLAKRLAGTVGGTKPGFLLLLGDQVYVDATAGLFDPTVGFDRFARPHQDLKDLLGRLKIRSAYMMLDDHEIEDNWEPPRGGGEDALLVEGRRAYLRQREQFGPDLKDPVGDSLQPLWYDLSLGGFPFFVSDTRTERMRRDAASIGAARIMSDAQMKALLEWLDAQPPELPKFVASPSILLPRRLRAARGHAAAALRSDAWDGYPASFHKLLARIAGRGIKHVVFLSGDEHLSCVTSASIAPEGGEPVRILSVHSSALYAPFPFANSVPEDLVAQESFTFSIESRRYRCDVVETRFVPGDGFAVLQVRKGVDGWKLSCDFSRDPAAPPLPDFPL